MKKNLFIVMISLMGIPAVWSQEFLLHDKTYTWNADDDVCGGFSYWYDHGNAPTMNWTYPYDYQNGLFYYYFEIIDQPSSAPFQLNFCIWADRSEDHTYWQESCGYRSSVLAGPGSNSQFSSPVLPAWNGGIDWTDLSKLWRYGIPLWVNGHNMGNGPYCTDNPEEWENYQLYFPLKLRVIVVAVASGYSFSGWSNYTGGCTPTKAPTPTYAIDYFYERTDKAVPSTDEYSYNSNMSGAVNGTGQKLTVTPGQDVYFRTKAGTCLLASDIQHLVVPYRPTAPSVSIDFQNERTVENIASTLEYSASSSYTDPITGTGTKVTVTPGQDLYFWVKATSGSFYSNVFHLTVPGRPAPPSFTIDFANERTNEAVSSTYEYATQSDMSGALTGNGSKLTVTPGTTLYFRVKYTSSSFFSSVFHLPVDVRPDIVTAAGDTIHDEFTATVDFHKAVTGFDASDIEVTNAGVTLTGTLTVRISPETDGNVTIKVVANAVTAGNFASDVFTTYYKKNISSLNDIAGSDGSLQVYPSPVGNELHIEITRNLVWPLDIKLVNSNGAVALRKTFFPAESVIDMKDLPSGLYILKAIDYKGNVISCKIIKQ